MNFARGFIQAAAVAGIPVLLANSAAAGSLTRLDKDHVSVQASGTPVGSILAELNALFPLDYLYIEPAIRSQRVSVHLESVSLADASVRILEESGVNFIVWSQRIYVGNPAAAVQIAKAGALQPSATPPAAVELAGASKPQLSAVEPDTPLGTPSTEEQATAAATFEASEYKMVGENIHYNDASFVTYKMRPEVVQRRVNTDVALIP
jgi:hypothetical protein